jgi:hypothetical protein
MNQTTFAKICRRGLTGVAVLLLGLIGASSCWAQSNNFGAPSIARPTTSPYLNLFNGTNRALDLGLNYQRRVRPELALRQNAAQTNTQVGGLQQQLNLIVGPDGNVRLPGTGHQTSFMNTQGYFGSGGAAPFGGNSPLQNRNPRGQNPLNQAITQNNAFNRNQGPAGASALQRR